MTYKEINAINAWARLGYGYQWIAAQTGISANTVKSYL